MAHMNKRGQRKATVKARPPKKRKVLKSKSKKRK